MSFSRSRPTIDQELNLAELQATIGAKINDMSEDDRLRTIARLVYEKGLDQGSVVKVTGLDQPTISRALKRVWQKKLIRFQVVPEAHEISETMLKDILLPRGVRRVQVVPRDLFGGKNIANLSEAGAELLLELILRHDRTKGPLHIVFSCGQTVLETLSRFEMKLREDHDRAARVRELEIHFSPATLWADKNYELSAAYPHTAVTYLHNLLSRDDLLRREFRRMHFFTPTLPAFYESLSRDEQLAFNCKARIDDFIERSKRAQIILTGIGTVTSEDFQKAHETEFESCRDTEGDLVRWPGSLDEEMAEICYQPIYDTGEPPQDSFKVVGLSLEDLKHAAGNVLESAADEERQQHVVAISGGILKARQVARVLRLRRLPFNTLITDPDVVSEVTRGRRQTSSQGSDAAAG